jgi:ABC-type transport system substrate-binding protein
VLTASPLAIISDDACKAAGDNWGITSYVGTGPYCFTSFKPGEKIVLTKFADYHGDAKKLDEIDIDCMDDNTALMQFEAGTIDVCGLSSELAESYKTNADYKDNVHYQDYYGVVTMVLNQSVAPFDNPLVRQAFALAVDKDAICNSYFNGSVTAAYSFLPPGIGGHDDSLASNNKRDVAKAKELLTKAGYPNGIKITTYISEANDVMTILQQQLAEANITLDLQLSDAATVSDMRTNGKLACWLLTWYADYNDADEFLYGVFTSSVADYFSTGWKNSDFDAAITKCRLPSLGSVITLYALWLSTLPPWRQRFHL